jgi:hypothetical protein
MEGEEDGVTGLRRYGGTGIKTDGQARGWKRTAQGRGARESGGTRENGLGPVCCPKESSLARHAISCVRLPVRSESGQAKILFG